MLPQIKGPALFLAQFAGDEAPFNSLVVSLNGLRVLATRVFKSQLLIYGCLI